MNKGVSIRDAANASFHLTSAGIMVHAYLMYGFPTQTASETVNSLEVVRQFFAYGWVKSAFWHKFTATAHSDIGLHPEKYGISILKEEPGGFAINDLKHNDPTSCNHDKFYPGLHKAVYNFMHGIGFNFPIQNWFEFKIPPVNRVDLTLLIDK